MSNKIGRNDPCPCGSGKKYKKCCMGKVDEDILLGKNEVMKDVKRFFDDFWTYELINEMSTEEIIERLNDFGIDFDEESFKKSAELTVSGETIAEGWFNMFPVNAKGSDEDFPCLAAMVLWERIVFHPNLSADQMESMIDKGFDYLDEDDSVKACDVWFKVWEGIKYRIKPEFKDTESLNEVYGTWFFVSNFCQDLEAELHNAGKENKSYYDKRIIYCREFLEYFPDEKELITHNMRRAICESYMELNDSENAENEYKKLIEDYPDNFWSYIAFGDYYFYGNKKNFNMSKELYEKGLSIAVNDEDKEIADDRLECAVMKL